MATELSVTKWWKTHNLKEDEEKRKAVCGVDHNDRLTVSKWPYRGHGDSTFKYPSKYRCPSKGQRIRIEKKDPGRPTLSPKKGKTKKFHV
jgi:hypothetical protein